MYDAVTKIMKSQRPMKWLTFDTKPPLDGFVYKKTFITIINNYLAIVLILVIVLQLALSGFVTGKAMFTRKPFLLLGGIGSNFCLCPCFC